MNACSVFFYSNRTNPLQAQDELQSKLDEYLDTVSRVSEDMVDLKWRQERTRITQGVH